MVTRYATLTLVLMAAGCAPLPAPKPAPASAVEAAVSIPDLAAPPPSASARTVEQFDTTTEAQRVAAAAGGASGGARLGSAVAVLGDPTRAGFWLETGLVEDRVPGRVVSKATGKAAEVELIPAGDGNARLSLAAMRLLGVALTDLAEVDIYGTE